MGRTELRDPSRRSRRGTLLALLAVAAALASKPGLAEAQIPVSELGPGDRLLELRLVDGSILIGRITASTAATVTLVTTGGTRIEVDRGQIREVRAPEGDLVDGEFWERDPNRSRLFFTSTGRSLREGEAYAGTYLIVLPFVGVGIHDRVTLAGGAPVLSGEFEPLYVAPKVQLVRTDAAQLSVGVLHFFFNDDGPANEDVGVAYGVATVGGENRALSAGLGFGYAGPDFSGQPVAMIGGEIRASRRTKWITENYFLPGETGAVLMGGIRFIGDRFSADVGVAGVVLGEGDAVCCIPLVNFAYAFGAGR